MTKKPSIAPSRTASSKKAIGKSPYRSPILRMVHEMATDLHSAGIMDMKTMSHFDEGLRKNGSDSVV